MEIPGDVTVPSPFAVTLVVPAGAPLHPIAARVENGP